MRSILSTVSIALITGLLAAGCGSDDDANGENAAAICSDIEALLNDKNALVDCPAGGEVLGGMCRDGLRSKPSCAREVRALYECATAQPDSSWGCHDVGEYPALETSTCSQQDDAIEACFSG